jgi:hypothetical protein
VRRPATCGLRVAGWLLAGLGVFLAGTSAGRSPPSQKPKSTEGLHPSFMSVPLIFAACVWSGRSLQETIASFLVPGWHTPWFLAGSGSWPAQDDGRFRFLVPGWHIPSHIPHPPSHVVRRPSGVQLLQAIIRCPYPPYISPLPLLQLSCIAVCCRRRPRVAASKLRRRGEEEKEPSKPEKKAPARQLPTPNSQLMRANPNPEPEPTPTSNKP